MRNSLADVVAAALRVLAAQGLEGCSMRRVAAELGVQPSALYHHVPDKQTLLALMADEIVAGVGERARQAAPGSAGDVIARRLCEQLRTMMLATRDGADVVATAAAFRMGASAVEDELAELVGRDGARTLLIYTFGQAQQTQMHRQAAAFGALVKAPVGSGSQASAGPDPASEVLAAHETDAAEGTDRLDDAFTRGLDVIFAGLAV